MATVTRTAGAHWRGGLVTGSGTISVGSGAFEPQPYTLDGRGSSDATTTSPEELVAGAHAACLAMAISAVLGGHGAASPDIRIDAACTQGPVGDDYRIIRMELGVTVRAEELSEAAIRAAVDEAAAGCPISAMMRGNVEVAIDLTVATQA